MQVMRMLLRPGWIALYVIVIAFAALCFTTLAPWQLNKSSSTDHRNTLIREAVDTPVVPLDEVAPAGEGLDPDNEWREVSMTGEFLAEDQALVRLRSIGDEPAVEILTPFRIAGTDRVVAINRGYVRPVQGATPEIAAPPPGQVEVAGRLRAPESTTRGAHEDNGLLALYTLDPRELAAETNTPMDPFYLQLGPNQPGSLGEIPLPQLDSGPYLSYGLQWLAFGIMAPLGAGYFILSEIKQRRRAQAASAPASAPSSVGEAGSDPTANRSARASRRRRLLADLRADEDEPNDTRFDRDDAPQIGAGPKTESRDDEVRRKLSQRYGG